VGGKIVPYNLVDAANAVYLVFRQHAFKYTTGWREGR
jgi:hypothetical protein